MGQLYMLLRRYQILRLFALNLGLVGFQHVSVYIAVFRGFKGII
jgi:hypothetical protein